MASGTMSTSTGASVTSVEPRVPRLVAGTLQLRPWLGDERDVQAVLHASRDPDIQRYSSAGRVNGHVEALAWIASRQAAPRIDWAIDHSATVVGRIGLHRVDDEDGVAEIGYWLLPEHRGKGIATQAVLAVTEWGFKDRGLGRLEIRHELLNQRSCLLASRCHFLPEGVQRGAMPRDPSADTERVDLHVHARLFSD